MAITRRTWAIGALMFFVAAGAFAAEACTATIQDCEVTGCGDALDAALVDVKGRDTSLPDVQSMDAANDVHFAGDAMNGNEAGTTDAADIEDAAVADAAAVDAFVAPVDANVPPTYAQVVLADNPIAYYRFEEGTGTVANNSSSSAPALKGTLVGGAHFAAVSASNGWPVGSTFAMEFDSAGGVVQVPKDSRLEPSSGLSIEFWLMPTGSGNTDPVAYGDFGSGGGNSLYGNGGCNQAYTTQYNSNRDIFFYIGAYNCGSSPPAGGFPTSADTIPLGTTTHFVVTYDLENVTFYVNGTATNHSASTTPLIYDPNNGAGLGIGDAYTRGIQFTGMIDEVAIYGAALDAGSIQTHFKTGRP